MHIRFILVVQTDEIMHALHKFQRVLVKVMVNQDSHRTKGYQRELSFL